MKCKKLRLAVTVWRSTVFPFALAMVAQYMTGEESSTLRELEAAPLSKELLDYYRSRVSVSEAEILALSGRIDGIVETHATQHKARWEVHKRMDEVSDLQKALSDTHMHMWEERERCQRLQAENDELKLQELEDRRKIQHLLVTTATRLELEPPADMECRAQPSTT